MRGVYKNETVDFILFLYLCTIWNIQVQGEMIRVC